ncbi:hypothetical protein O4J56_14855 [Nocardiopsis sp. RSe5-2]|uniref:Uncharacterized protein n=1 Tax=Nocardiopsis endophytica TaxID=3018445 RepID=A0ABT4U4N5_9ACTN|nr:hypothetical protein [Nocardiopsis endophytica]MDA2811921.1 hypothetical protein [Nocardiopsis endophytica]
MYGFYLFEGSFHQGGGGWERYEVGTGLDQVKTAAARYIREGWWVANPGDTCAVRVYRGGEVEHEAAVYPFTRVKVPGFAWISFDDKGRPVGGEPEPGGRHEGTAPLDLWGAVLPEALNECPGEIEVTIDWERMALPGLEPPLLPEGASLVVDHAEGTATAFGHDLSDEEHDDLTDELYDDLSDDQVILTYGSNDTL